MNAGVEVTRPSGCLFARSGPFDVLHELAPHCISGVPMNAVGVYLVGVFVQSLEGVCQVGQDCHVWGVPYVASHLVNDAFLAVRHV